MTAKIKLAAIVLQRYSHMAITSFPLLNNLKLAFKNFTGVYFSVIAVLLEKVLLVQGSANYQCASHFWGGKRHSIKRNESVPVWRRQQRRSKYGTREGQSKFLCQLGLSSRRKTLHKFCTLITIEEYKKENGSHF